VLTGRAKNEAFGRADLFAFPSVAPYESFGLVLIEAMAWGLPIVASDWRGNREVLTPEAGAIFFPVSPSPAGDLEAAFEEALSRRDEWADWGEANRRIFTHRYCESRDPQWLTAPVLSLLRTAG
jgi:glycosyltransferase involved in cell wall biosynthesis